MTAITLVTVANWHSFVYFQPLFSFRTGFEEENDVLISRKMATLKKLFKMQT